jgi:hypothetical protein
MASKKPTAKKAAPKKEEKKLPPWLMKGKKK